MTSLTYEDRHDWVRPAKETVLTVVSLAAIVCGFWRLVVFSTVSSIQAVYHSSVTWTYLSLLTAGIAYTVASCILLGCFIGYSPRSKTPNRFFANFWSGLGKMVKIYPFNLWLASLALFPALAVGIATLCSSQLDTPQGYVRLMDDGRVMVAGTSARGELYRVTSVPIALNYSLQNAVTTVPTSNGIVTVGTAMTYSLKQGDALNEFISKDQEQLGWGQEYPSSAQGHFFTQPVENYMAPKVAQVVREVQAGQISGSLASMKLELGRLLQEDHSNRPAWLSSLQVDGVQIDNWQAAD